MRAWSLVAVMLAACDGGGSGSDQIPDAAGTPTSTCGSVRYTWYTAAKGGWCEYDRTAPMLPDFVRAGLTLAIGQRQAEQGQRRLHGRLVSAHLGPGA
jgi:hypothetical protein